MSWKRGELLRLVVRYISKPALMNLYSRTSAPAGATANEKKELVVGPLRVLPGRLSVSRTFGDAEAKLS